MPTPGPRTQFGPDEGYRNPEMRAPDFFNQWDRPGPIWWPGRSPGMSVISLRGNILATGQIRRLWQQAVDLIPAQSSFSWTLNGLASRGVSATGGVGVTRALRYMTRSLYWGQGIDNTRYERMHSVVRKQHASKQVTLGLGQTRSRPTVRNRMVSFGSRIPPLNYQVAAAQGQNPGVAGQA